MYLGQLPQPGTPEFRQLAAYRRAVLQGTVPQDMTFAQYQEAYPLPSAAPVPGTPAFSTMAARRKAALTAATFKPPPFPETRGPSVLERAADELRAAEMAALGGLTKAVKWITIGLAAYLGFSFLARR